jgi:Fe-S cluster assembly iron-binding protein IscA
MRIDITNNAREELTKVLAKRKDDNKLLRIYIAGYG